MRESSLSLDKALVHGVLPVLGSNLLGLSSCKNARPYGVGMEYVAPYSSYLDLTGEYPFPQLLVGEKYQYVANATGIYSINIGVLNLKKTQAATTHYDLVDFKDSVAIVGNGHTLFRSVTGDLSAMAHVPEASCACEIGHMLLLGNISSWDQSTDVDSSTVVWAARPLSVEFQLLDAASISTGAGYIKLFCGDILRLFSKGNLVYVFGKKGIVVLKLISDPVKALSIEVEMPCTIKDREAIVQHPEGFSFIDAFGYAFGLALRETRPKRFGLRRFFQGARVVGMYDPAEQETLFCNGLETISMGTYGVGSRDQVITSGGVIDSVMCVASPTINSQAFTLEVASQNMGVAGIKTLYAAGVDYETDGSVRINDSPANSLGVGTKIISADSFKPTVKITDCTHATVTALELRWKLTDKRNVRGRYDNQTTA